MWVSEALPVLLTPALVENMFFSLVPYKLTLCAETESIPSWQDMAKIDFPTVLDFVLKETNQSKIYLTGNSMGGTIPFAFLSRNHSYDDNVSLIRPREVH